MKYYDGTPLLKEMKKKDAKYGLAIGKRSNGKTYFFKTLALFGNKKLGLTGYIQTGEQFAYVRRYEDDFKGKRATQMFDDVVKNGTLEKETNGKWNDIEYYRGAWWLVKWNESRTEKKRDSQPFGFAMAINTTEHDKSTSYPNVTRIIFDEFLSRTSYLVDEFVKFMNLISTIVRLESKVTIFMLGNTVNKYSPYFDEMGLTHVAQMAKGSIETYTYHYENNNELNLCIEYCDDTEKGKSKPSDVYFAFNNPRLQMITNGDWEIASYPHKPHDVRIFDESILMVFFISFDRNLLQCELIQQQSNAFIYIHRKTTPIKNKDDIVYSIEYSPKPNMRRKLFKPQFEFERVIVNMFENEKVFYQDNTVGEVVRNYYNWCITDTIS